VTVADTAGRVLNGGGESGMSRDQQLQMEDLYEAQLELAAQTMLATALGPGHSVVRVTADLNFDELEQESVTFDADTQIALREQQIDEAFTGDANVPIGTLGTANDVSDIGDIAGDEGDAYIRTETNAEYGVPSVTTRTRQAPGRVERLSVAVLVDEAVDPSPDPAQLSSLVSAAVGIDETRGDTIVVQSLTFDEVAAEDLEDVALAAPAGAGLEPMIGYAKTGVAILGLLLALLFLRKGLKTLTPVVREPVDIDPAKLAALTAAEEGGQAPEVQAAEAAKEAQRAAEKQTRELTAAAAADLDIKAAPAQTDTTIDMFDLIDAQSDEVAHLLRDLVADSVT
jgi:flagellar M-ring protein FliF